MEEIFMKRKFSKFILLAVAVLGLFVTLAGKAQAQGADPFIGQLAYVAFSYAPRGWAACDGQLLEISQNQTLYSLLGTKYGGDGRTNFALPDMRGRVPIHMGQGPGLSPYAIGRRGGFEKIALDATFMPTHSHTNTASSDSTSTSEMSGSAGGATLNAYNGDGNKATAAGNSLANLFGVKTSGGGKVPAVYSDQPPNAPMMTGSVSVDLSGIGVTTTTTTGTTVTIGDAGGQQPFTLIQPYLTVNCIIATDGLYPPRS